MAYIKPMANNLAVLRAAKLIGSQAELSRAVGVERATVNQWIKGKRQVPAERCVLIEQATKGGVSRRELRPDWESLWPELAIG